MLLEDEQHVIKWLSQYGALPKTQILQMLYNKPRSTAEKIIRNLKRNMQITDVGGGYYLGLDGLCKPDQRMILAVWVLLKFINVVDPMAHYPATYPAQLFFLKENTGYEIVVLYEGEQHLSKLLHTVSERPSLYLARDLKKINASEQNKTMFTRTVGALFYPGGCYAIYNTRSSIMKWSGMGEFKSRLSLQEIARLNAGIETVDSAVLMGESEMTAMDTLLESERTHRPEFRFDSIYQHVHFVPLNEFGASLLRLLTIENWNNRLMDLLFDADVRSYGRGTLEYDAYIDGKYVLSHLDGDLARLIRFREAIRIQNGVFEVLCFPEQMQLLREYLPPEVTLKVISLNAVLDQFHREEGCP